MVKYVYVRITPEFKDWLMERKRNMEKVSSMFGGIKKIPLTKVQQIISRTGRIHIEDDLMKQILKKKK